MKDISAITGAEYAERLLAVNSPTRLIDHLIEKLAAKTGSSYHKRPDSDDPDSQDCFEWNVMHAFIALAAIVHPVKKDDDLIEVCRTKKNRSESVIFYRDRITAKTRELTKYRDIRNYEENREPADNATSPSRTT